MTTSMTRAQIRRLLAASGLLLLLLPPWAAMAQSITLEKYYPHRVNRVLVFEYTTAAEGEQRQSYEGTLTRSVAGPETRDGVTYQTVEHTTRGLPDFYPRRWKTYHRETEDGLYSGQLNESGALEEYLELPASARPGEPWDARSLFWERQTLSLVPRVETPAGTLENCIRVERFREEASSRQTLTNNTIYCPGLSAVRSTVEHVAPKIRSVTELSLIEVRR